MSLSNLWFLWLICFCVIGLYFYLYFVEVFEVLVGSVVDVIFFFVFIVSVDGIYFFFIYYKLILICRK